MREEGKRHCPSLSLYGVSNVFFLLRVHPEGPKGDWGTKSKDPKEPWVEELTRTWEKEDSTLVFTRLLGIKGWLISFPIVKGLTLSDSSEITGCFWDLAVFLFLVSVPSIFSLGSTLLTFSYLIFFSIPSLMEVAAPIASTAPLLIGTPEKVSIIRSHPNQFSKNSYI